MDDGKPDEAIHISSDDARGASSADGGSGATLLPMLGMGLVLVIIGVIVILLVVG